MAVVFRARKPMHNPVPYAMDRSIYGDPNLPKCFMRHRMATVKNLHCRDLKAHYGCVNAIEFSNKGGEFIVSGGDDRRVLLWNVEKEISNIGKPVVLQGEHNSNIFSLAFSADDQHVFSGGNDEQVVLHDLATGETQDVFLHNDAVYGLSTDPNNANVFASACDDGRILIYDIREAYASSDPFCLAHYGSSMHAVMYNPAEPRLLATANAKEGVGLWDIRKPKVCLLRYGGAYVHQSCMSVRINQRGDRILALRRRLPPVLYDLACSQPLCEFDHEGYYNSCTMKSCSFAGDNDEYVLSGSDDFNLYMWKIPETLTKRSSVTSAHMVLKGHRSIVNQVRYNRSNSIIISSGVEKIIKMWSSFKLPVPEEAMLEEGRGVVGGERQVYTHEEYINLVLRSGHIMSHDYSHQSTEEDPRMLAFFDSLVQREVEYWSSDDLSSAEEEIFDRILLVSQAERSQAVQVRANNNNNNSSDSSTSSTSSSENPENRNNGRDLPAVPGSGNSDDDEGNDVSPFTLAFASVMAAQAAEGDTGVQFLMDAGGGEEEGEGQGQDEDQAEAQGDQTDNSSPQPPRRTIREIISQNRTMFQKLRFMELADRKKRAWSSRSSRTASNLSFTVVDNSSESEESDTERNASRTLASRVLQQRLQTQGRSGQDSARLPSSASRPSSSAARTATTALPTLNRNMQSRLKRLRTLRHHVLHSDSDTSDEDQSVGGPPPAKMKSQTRESLPQVSSDRSEGTSAKTEQERSQTVEASAPVAGPSKGHSNLEFGPFLHKVSPQMPAGFGSNLGELSQGEEKLSRGANSSNLGGASAYLSSEAVIEPNQDKVSNRSRPGESEGKETVTKAAGCTRNHHENSMGTLGTSQCSTKQPCSNGMHNRNSHTENEREQEDDGKFASRGASRATASDSGASRPTGTGDVGDGESPSSRSHGSPMWREFNRFKHRMERAHRYYRKHSGHGSNNDDDEDDDDL